MHLHQEFTARGRLRCKGQAQVGGARRQP